MPLAAIVGYHPTTTALGRRSSSRIRSCVPSCRARLKDRARHHAPSPYRAVGRVRQHRNPPRAAIKSPYRKHAAPPSCCLPAVSSLEASRRPAARARVSLSCRGRHPTSLNISRHGRTNVGRPLTPNCRSTRRHGSFVPEADLGAPVRSPRNPQWFSILVTAKLEQSMKWVVGIRAPEI
jgi:hypothetical protein